MPGDDWGAAMGPTMASQGFYSGLMSDAASTDPVMAL